MTPNPQATIHHKCRELILLLQINLNHFPRHEKYGLCQEIRQCVYGVLAGIVECQKRYHNKTSLTKLDVQHEQLRVFVNLAFELGYFSFEHHKRARSESEALRRYTTVSVLGHARHTASFARMARRCMENKTILASLPPVIQLSFGELDAAE